MSVFCVAHLHRRSEFTDIMPRVDHTGALAGAAQWLDMDIFNIITGEPVERCMLPCSGDAREELGGAVAPPIIAIAPTQHPQEMSVIYISCVFHVTFEYSSMLFKNGN